MSASLPTLRRIASQVADKPNEVFGAALTDPIGFGLRKDGMERNHGIRGERAVSLRIENTNSIHIQ